MRWLVPSASARLRRLRSLMPCSATYAIAASSSRPLGSEPVTCAVVYHLVHHVRSTPNKSPHRSPTTPRGRLRLPRRNGQPRAIHRSHDGQLEVRRPAPRGRLQGARRRQARRPHRPHRDRGRLAQAPERIVEQNVGAGGRRVANGTYILEELPAGETRIIFEYAWQRAPVSERLGAPLVRSVLRRGNERAMERLAALLAGRQSALPSVRS